MAPRLDPNAAASKLGTRIGQSGAAYLAGVNAVTESPMEKAALAEDKWFAGLQDAFANKRFSKGLRKVTLARWKQIIQQVGQSRYTGGAQKAQENYLSFATEFFPLLQQVVDRVNAMPNLTFEDNIARMVENARGIHALRNR